ncbi:hypothetical protein FBY35_1109 [Streptomyces sp. SLBN-118]|uniref:hypothetical protein n=1 Tax=Streptomyces sp. SLBN-118 TaxID=2768454 RepID=UPI0011506F0D|nr:hypothetical protein [Streptomyces sp. SLBN-118]TQK50759.1 hypothetical protein FBY35_1109 [Streptomyces sp. SLBN-118]
MIYCGIDWIVRTDNVTFVYDIGSLLTRQNITDDAGGYRNLLDLLTEYRNSEEMPLPPSIEAFRGLLIVSLTAALSRAF